MNSLLNRSFSICLLLLMLGFYHVFTQERNLHYEVLEDFQVVDARKEIKMPGIKGYKTLKGDFHMHTIYSDGHVTPQTRVVEAWREGLDVIAITDHSTPMPRNIKGDYNSAYNDALSYAKSRGITLIRATEYTQREPYGHLNFLFVEDANVFAKSFSELYPVDAIEMAAGQGAFVILNHPGWPDKNSKLDDVHIDLINRGKIHGIEVFNAHEFYPLVADYCVQYPLTIISASDIHAPIGASFNLHQQPRNLTLIFAKDNSEESVKEALFDRRTLAFANNLIVGNEKYIIPFVKNSIQVTNFQKDDTRFSCHMTNNTDVTYTLYGPEQQRIVLPAQRTIRLSDQLDNMEVVYQVKNTFINATDHAAIPLSIFFAAEDEVLVPMIKQDLSAFDPNEKLTVYSLTEGAEIYYTKDGSEPTPSSEKYTKPIGFDRSTRLTFKAFKKGMKPSRTVVKQVLLDIDHPSVKLSEKTNGLKYQYFEGPFLSVKDFEVKGKLQDEGIMDLPDITKAKAEDHFGFIFKGYLFAPKTGKYLFTLESDDGSTLRISDVDLVDNDGSHSLKRKSGEIKLEKGYHRFELRHFDDFAEEALRFLWTIPGEKEKEVSKEFFFIEK
ncbi:MAG: chitobiase/beta-hexosaminidase C-terminal domain-containing protein [Bacteroidota bacterium]